MRFSSFMSGKGKGQKRGRLDGTLNFRLSDGGGKKKEFKHVQTSQSGIAHADGEKKKKTLSFFSHLDNYRHK